MKLFENTRLGVEGLQSLFWDEITPAHHGYFVSQLRFRWLARDVKDVGVYRYHGKVLSTTHAASFSLGLEPRCLFSNDLGEFLRNIMAEYGSYFGRIGERAESSDTSFLDFLDVTQFAKKEEDYRAEEFYRQVFNGSETPQLNSTLLLLLGHLNFIDEVVTAGSNPGAPSYTLLKIRFLGIYQIVRSLAAVFLKDKNRLTPASVAAIEAIVQHPVATLLASDKMRPLRNTFTHYDVDSRLRIGSLNVYGLSNSMLTASLGSSQAESFGEELDKFISSAAGIMNNWM